MRIAPIALLLIAGLSGCHSTPAVDPVPPAPLVPSLAAPVGVRIPEVVRSYAVGAYIDPDDPSVRHEAHVVQRVESPARWDLRTVVPPPAVAESKAELVPVIKTMATPPAPVVAPPETPSPPPLLEPALAPNAEGIIDLALALPPAVAEGDNPFAVRRSGVAPTREVTLHVAGLVGGANPCALINERLVQVGEIIETLLVVQLEDRSVLLRAGDQLLRVPVSADGVRIRLPL